VRPLPDHEGTGSETHSCVAAFKELSGQAVAVLQTARRLKIEMIVASTFWIELGAASRATKLALQVLLNRQLCATGAAKYCFLAPFAFWPDLDFVFGKRCVALLARIVDATALHLDRNDVGCSVEVFAAGLRIEVNATHIWKVRSHCTKKSSDRASPPR